MKLIFLILFSGLFLADKTVRGSIASDQAIQLLQQFNVLQENPNAVTPDQLDSIQNGFKILQSNLSSETQGLVTKAMSLTENIRTTVAQGEDPSLIIKIVIKFIIVIIIIIIF
jgi:hypothetical protein